MISPGNWRSRRKCWCTSKDYELLLREASGEDIEPRLHWLGWRKEVVLAAFAAMPRKAHEPCSCQVYRSSRKQEMYLYVDKARGLRMCRIHCWPVW